MNVTIKNINGTDYTVVKPEADVKDCEVENADRFFDWCGVLIAINRTCVGNEYVVAYALPPLPRHPKPGDARLLYRYMADGLIPCFDSERLDRAIISSYCKGSCRITHCLNDQGETVNVAITEE